MENLKEFLEVQDRRGSGSGFGGGGGSGFGRGDGSGFGRGDGSGFGRGDGSGSGRGDGSGSGYSFGRGDGSGFGRGDGSGSGRGDGSGSGYSCVYGSGYSYGISRICNTEVHTIDGVSTLIYCVRHGIAKGAILNKDLTTTPCFIVKGDGRFAHGETLREAQEALTTKLMDDMPENERIALFLEAHKQDCAYSVKDLFEWHHRLTGSCLEGRKAFAKNHDIDMNGAMTIKEFIELTRNSYGGAVIQNMEKEWKNGRH